MCSSKLVWLFFLILGLTLLVSAKTLVCSHDGCYVGRERTGHEKPYYAWYSIPFALPPVGPLRFKKPVCQPKLNDPWDATYPRSMCMQRDRDNKIVGNEDCLYLNVYRPRNIRIRTKLPVLVFIHGGGFKTGSADPNWYGPEFLMNTEGVILVIPQYRLGVFGFAASGDASIKGNFGLKDQNCALQWVHRNIESFNGDPKNVTLMGDSAGSASTHYQMLSETSNNLFQRAVMTGGQAYAPWAFDKTPIVHLRQLAAVAGIRNAKTISTEIIAEALRSLPAWELQEYCDQMYVYPVTNSIFLPVAEGPWRSAFIRQHPRKIMKSGVFEKRPILVTVTTNEQSWDDDVCYNKKLRAAFLADFDNSLQQVTGVCDCAIPLLRKYYFNDNPLEYNCQNILTAMRQHQFYIPAILTVKEYVEIPNIDLQRYPVDVAYFNFNSTYTFSEMIHRYPHPELGPGKYDTSIYIFNFRVLNGKFQRGRAEEAVTKTLVQLLLQYMSGGFVNTPQGYRPCTAQLIASNGFCDYLTMSRGVDGMPEIGISNFIVSGALEIQYKIDALGN